MWKDFKAFALRGVVLDLAVAVVIGAAFKAIVDSFVNDVFTPIVAALFGKPDFTDLGLTLRHCAPAAKAAKSCRQSVVHYGNFLTQITNFVIVAAAVFVMIKAFERLRTLRLLAVETGEVPVAVDEVTLLTEIRDLLREQASE
ncbi:MAG TPA: large conductance mechanosensitive channel protein MscL [Acidimicrobiia bacterium]|nr:large conductance mechanosensitive channel protein MscL [Acidimicrobiia bacterium]